VSLFSLTNQHRDERHLAGFRGKIVMPYFGSMHCTDVCPIDLRRCALALRKYSGATIKQACDIYRAWNVYFS
jgi:cytochrome oxidase Cu insertion factor (SCO1/SenC/PrrC family)